MSAPLNCITLANMKPVLTVVFVANAHLAMLHCLVIVVVPNLGTSLKTEASKSCWCEKRSWTTSQNFKLEAISDCKTRLEFSCIRQF